MYRLFISTILFSTSSFAVQYTAPGNPDIIQLHNRITWEQSCQSYDGTCDVPPGNYQLTILDRNWNKLETVPSITIGSNTTPTSPNTSTPAISIVIETQANSSVADLIKYFGKGSTLNCSKGTAITGICTGEDTNGFPILIPISITNDPNHAANGHYCGVKSLAQANNSSVKFIKVQVSCLVIE